MWVEVENSGHPAAHPQNQGSLSPEPEIIVREVTELYTCCARLGIEGHLGFILSPIITEIATYTQFYPHLLSTFGDISGD